MRASLLLLLTVLAGLSHPPAADAYFLDKNHDFDVRLRAYSQLAIMTNNPEIDSPPFHFGSLGSNRNFYNPEFDANLARYAGWMENIKALAPFRPDNFKFRFA